MIRFISQLFCRSSKQVGRKHKAKPSLTTTLIGTSAYIPIEVHLNPKHRDRRQDVYACGVLLYQVITGSLPRVDDYQFVEEGIRA